MSETMNKILAKAAEKQAELKLSLLQRRRKLVVACHNGKFEDGTEVDPDAVVLELEELGLSAEDLDADLEKYAQRMALFDQVEAGNRAESELPALRAKLESLASKFKPIHEKYLSDSGLVEHEILQASHALMVAQAAKSSLRDSAGDDAFEEADQLSQEVKQLEQQKAGLRRQVKTRRDFIADTQDLKERGFLRGVEPSAAALERLPGAIQQLAEDEQAILELDERIVDLNEEQDRVYNAAVTDPTMF